jgi:hypothetical protein
MTKKQLYTAPQTEVFELSYAEPVCQATSGEIPDYDLNPLDPADLFSTPGLL